MIRAIFLFIILGLGIFVGTQFSGQQGYVLISIANKTVEMSVTTLILLIVALLASLFFIEYLIKKTLYVSSTTWNWFSVRKLKRARRYTNEGIVKLLEGDWQEAEKKVTKWANHHDMPLLCYLVASEAAQEMGDSTKREHYLELAQQQDNSELAVQLTKARQQVKDQQFDQALETLSTLKSRYPNNLMLLGLLKATYINLKLWQPLLELLPQLEKLKQIDTQEKNRLAQQAQIEMLKEQGKLNDSEALLAYWNRLPRKLRKDMAMITCLIELLVSNDSSAEAYTFIKEALKKQPKDDLIALLPKLQLADTHPVILQLQGMLKKGDENATAHSALAQLLYQQEKWPEAQTHFEKALSIRASVSDYSYLAEVLDKQNLTKAASDVSRKALTLVEAS